MDKYKVILENIKNRDFEKAEKICSEIQNLENDHIALNLLGLTQIKQNKYNLAEKNFIRSSMIDETFEASIKNLFFLYLEQKKTPKMLFCAKKLINLNKNIPDYNYFLAMALELNNDYDEAIALYNKSIELNYRQKQNSFNNIGNILLRNKKPEESIKYFQKAHELDQKNIYIIYNLLSNYAELRDVSNLEINLQKLLSLDKNSKTYFYYKAELLILKNEITKAKEILVKNLDDIRFVVKLIRLNFIIGDFEEARKIFSKIKYEIDHDPNYNNFLANTFLCEGDFQNGWKYYNRRRSKIDSKYTNIKEWTGEPLINKKILVFSEQGIGDTIQFSKYLIPLLKLSKNVTFVIQEKIIKIFKNDIEGLNLKLRQDINEQNYDFKIDLGSLIKFFYKEKINNAIMLFNLPNKKKNQILNIDKSKLNVGISWSGSFYGPTEPYRTLDLSNLKKLFSLNINFYCLQNEIRDSDYDFFKSSNIIDCSNFDLCEIVQIINDLDLVISVDTSILHLSASFNKETWGLLALYPDWRWGKFNEFNPYSYLKIFRQKKFNCWDDIISDVYDQLKSKLILKK